MTNANVFNVIQYLNQIIYLEMDIYTSIIFVSNIQRPQY